MMQVWLGSKSSPQWPQGSAVTIGNFDGVHCGHRHILMRLNHEAKQRGLPAVVVVFEPQPPEFFARQQHKPLPYRLSPLRDKLDLLAATGAVDAVWVWRFNQHFAQLSADDFMRHILIEKLNCRYLLVGDDFRFGRQRQGDFTLLAQQPEFATERTPSILINDVRASSTAIRQALLQGDLAYAQTLLGHTYCLSGKVKHGAQLGRTLNCPTANVHLPPLHYAMNGVFVVEAEGQFGRRRGVASFGLNPTVSATTQQKLEVHLFDYQGNLYEKRIRVHFLHKLRDEVKFTSLAALEQQIAADMAAARIWTAA